MRLDIFLEAEGDCFSVSNGEYKLTEIDAEKIHPVIKKMVSANTRADVVDALKEFKNEAKKEQRAQGCWDSNIYSIESGSEKISITLLHANAYSYKGHFQQPGAIHRDSIKQMIAFADGSDRTPRSDCSMF